MNFEGYQFYDLLAVIAHDTLGIFAVHPRARKTLGKAAKLTPTIWLVDSQLYLECNYMVRHTNVVITNSGNITKKATGEGGAKQGCTA